MLSAYDLPSVKNGVLVTPAWMAAMACAWPSWLKQLTFRGVMPAFLHASNVFLAFSLQFSGDPHAKQS